MGRGRPRKPIVLSPQVREELLSLSRSRTLPHGLVRRANIILMSADGFDNRMIARQVGLSAQSVCVWRSRFLRQGLMGLYDERRSGRPRRIDAEKITALIRKTLTTKPADGSTHWTCRSIAAETKISKSEVQRIWSTLGIAPHRQKHFKLSNDPFFTEKVRDIVGLYLNPRTRPWCFVWTRRVRRRRWNVPNRSCPWDWATWKA